MSDSKNGDKEKYFSMSDAYSDVDFAFGAKDTAIAGLKMLSKGIFNIGRFTGEIAVDIGKQALITTKKAKNLEGNYSLENDDYLKSKRKNGTAAEKMASGSVLKRRK